MLIAESTINVILDRIEAAIAHGTATQDDLSLALRFQVTLGQLNLIDPDVARQMVEDRRDEPEEIEPYFQPWSD